jgi:hypothetical protein
MLIDLILDMIFIGAILIVAIPVVAAIIAAGATLIIFFSGAIGTVGTGISFPILWIAHRNHRNRQNNRK